MRKIRKWKLQKINRKVLALLLTAAILGTGSGISTLANSVEQNNAKTQTEAKQKEESEETKKQQKESVTVKTASENGG